MSQPMMLLQSARKDPKAADHHIDRATWLRIAGYGRGLRLSLVVFASLAAVLAFQEIAIAFTLRTLVDRGLGGDSRSVLLWLVALFAGLELLRVACDVVLRWLSAVIGERLIHTLRQELYAKIQSLPISFHTHSTTGGLQSRITSDVVSAKDAFTSVLRNVLVNVFVLAGTLWGMLLLSWQVTLLGLMLVPLALIPTKLVSAKIRHYSVKKMRVNGTMQSHLGDRFNVGGALLVKLFGDVDQERRDFERMSREACDLGVKAATVQKLYMSLFSVVAAVAVGVVYAVGGLQVLAGQLTVGTVLAMAMMIVRLYVPITVLSGARIDLVTSALSFQRVFEVLDFDRDRHLEPTDPQPLPAGPEDLRFDSVSFAYPDAAQSTVPSLSPNDDGEERGVQGKSPATMNLVLQDVSFTVPAGALVAVVGASGAGKSTLAQLACRLYDPTAGTVSLGGVDLRDCASIDLARRVSMVPQESHMFQASIADNLRYAKPDASDAELDRVLEQACLSDLIDRLPDGLETQVGSRGYRLSGGEKQRLAIARLLLRSPDVVILDESTAHLDSVSERDVQEAMDVALRGRSALVIAHRLSTIQHADQIVVMHDGRVVEAGKHQDLIAQQGRYFELWAGQSAHDKEIPPLS